MRYGGGYGGGGGGYSGGIPSGGYTLSGLGPSDGSYAIVEDDSQQIQADPNAQTTTDGTYTESKGSDALGLGIAQQIVGDLNQQNVVTGSQVTSGAWAEQGGSVTRADNGDLVVTNGYVMSYSQTTGTYELQQVTGGTSLVVDHNTGVAEPVTPQSDESVAAPGAAVGSAVKSSAGSAPGRVAAR
jgi:hypothetical protein